MFKFMLFLLCHYFSLWITGDSPWKWCCKVIPPKVNMLEPQTKFKLLGCEVFGRSA